jgi:DNA-nicking Smr family endonuclease
MPRRRRLNPEEERLWHEVARTVHRRAGPHPAVPAPALGPPPAPEVPPRPDPLPRFRLGERAAPASAPPRPAAIALAMDAKLHTRMTRGRLAPEARLDLHGMTLAEAHPELVRFVLGAQAQGLRLVLIITGKGKPPPDHDPLPRRTGLLRHQVPVWLRQPPLGPAVQQVAEAHLRHGGAGALYVYLRRVPR